MNKGFKFISRLIVGIALIIISGVMVWNIFNTIVVPKLSVMKGADYVQDLSGSMKEPDKTYARNAIEEDSKKEKIAIVLDYQLTSFTVNDTYVDKMVNSVVKNVYRNQKYIVYTYFKDTNKLVISTNINDSEHDVMPKTKTEIDTDDKVVKEILYFQQNLKKQHYGLTNWNFNLNTEYMRDTALQGVGCIILFILGLGVLPAAAEGFRNPFRRRKASTHSKPATTE